MSEFEDEQVNERRAREMSRGLPLPMALKTAIELDILEIISEGGGYLSAKEVAGKIRGCVNPDAPALLDSLLCLLASFSVVKCETRNSEAGVEERVYGVAPLSKYFLKKELTGLQDSLAPMHLMRYDKVTIDLCTTINNNEHGLELARAVDGNSYSTVEGQLTEQLGTVTDTMRPVIRKKFLDLIPSPPFCPDSLSLWFLPRAVFQLNELGPPLLAIEERFSSLGFSMGLRLRLAHLAGAGSWS